MNAKVSKNGNLPERKTSQDVQHLGVRYRFFIVTEVRLKVYSTDGFVVSVTLCTYVDATSKFKLKGKEVARISFRHLSFSGKKNMRFSIT